jgi:hypothetical protein
MKLAPVLRLPRAEVGLAFRHFGTGEAWAHNDRRFPAGDLIRLALAMAAYGEATVGRLTLSMPITLKNPLARAGPRHDVLAFDDLLSAPEGTQVTVRDLIRRTLEGRDNLAPALLLESLDLRDINRTLSGWGLARTLLDGPPSEGVLHVTTPNEMAILLAHLMIGADLSAEVRQEALSFLRLRKLPSPLRKLAGEADPAHMEAEGDGFRHVIYLSPGPHGYLLAILTEGRIGAAGVSKVVSTVDAHYAGAHDSLDRVMTYLDSRRSNSAPDQRTVTWDVRPQWRDGKLSLTGRISLPEWPAIVEDCRAATEVAVVDHVRRLGATPPWAVALAPVIHLRKEPTHASELVSQVVMGTLLAVLEAGEEWWYVRAPDGMLAWARSTNLQPATDRDADRWRSRDHVLITAPLVVAPRLTHGSVTLSAGTHLAFVGRRKDDLLGRAPGREELLLPAYACRYIPSDAPPTEPTAENVIRLAEPFLGVPYLWGGSSGWGLDCSGFTQLVFRMAGLNIPRDSDQQMAMAQSTCRVDHIKDLAPGDLVFFKGHVGICLGRGEFVHASAPAGCVTVNALIPGAQHYASALVKRFLGGGRILGMPREESPQVPPSPAKPLDVLPGTTR